jgi:hypothetical protein
MWMEVSLTKGNPPVFRNPLIVERLLGGTRTPVYLYQVVCRGVSPYLHVPSNKNQVSSRRISLKSFDCLLQLEKKYDILTEFSSPEVSDETLPPIRSAGHAGHTARLSMREEWLLDSRRIAQIRLVFPATGLPGNGTHSSHNQVPGIRWRSLSITSTVTRKYRRRFFPRMLEFMVSGGVRGYIWQL